VQRRTTKFFLKTITIILAVVIVVGYSYYRSKNFLEGPQINITSPKNNEATTTELISIIGKAKNINVITLDDRNIFTDKDGNFLEHLLLLPGYNVIKVNAKDKFGKTLEKIIEIVYNKAVVK